MCKKISKRIFTVALIISMFVSHAPTSILAVNAVANDITIDEEYGLELDDYALEVDEYVSEVGFASEEDENVLEAGESLPEVVEVANDISIESDYPLIVDEEGSILAAANIDLDYLCGPVVTPPETWNCSEDRGWCWQLPNEPFAITQSEITLPYRRLTDSERAVWLAEYLQNGPIDFEREVIRLLNIERVRLGLNTVELDPVLAMASRFHAQIMSTFGVDRNWSHHVGPYSIDGRGASLNTSRAFGAVGSWSGNAATGSGNRSPGSVVQGLLNSPGHCRSLLNPANRFIGPGVHAGGFMGGSSNYVMLSHNPSQNRHTATIVDGAISTVLGSTTVGSFLANETVEITATVPTGYRFLRWEGSVDFANANSASTTFEMPANNVTVTAILERTAPTEVTTAPTEVTTAPTEVTTAPTEVTTAPTEVTTAPTEVTTAPTEVTTAPTEATTAPTEATTAPTEATTAPTEVTTAPTEATTAPTEATTAPTEATTAPTEATTAPTEATTAPTEPTEPTTEPTDQNPELTAAINALTALIAEIAELDAADYTAESWALLELSLAAAMGALDSDDIDAILTATRSLKATFDALVYINQCSSRPCSSQPCSSRPCSSQPCSSRPCSSQPCSSQPTVSLPSPVLPTVPTVLARPQIPQTPAQTLPSQSLPQTGVAVVPLSLSGLILIASGLGIATKKKNDK